MLSFDAPERLIISCYLKLLFWTAKGSSSPDILFVIFYKLIDFFHILLTKNDIASSMIDF